MRGCSSSNPLGERLQRGGHERGTWAADAGGPRTIPSATASLEVSAAYEQLLMAALDTLAVVCGKC